MRRRVMQWTEGWGPKLVSVSERSDTKQGYVIGLDLSLRATAACAIPIGWDHDLKKVRMAKFGRDLGNDSSQEERIARMCEIAEGVLAFCKKMNMKFCSCEDHAFGAGGRNAMQTVEMTGIVKREIYKAFGFAIVPIVAGRARKILLQKLPRSDVKKFTVRNVKRLGGPTSDWTDDEIDSFVISNARLMMEGGTAMTFLGEP